MIFLIRILKLIIYVLCILSLNVNAEKKTEIVFKINDQSFSNFNLENRKKYLNLLSDNYIENDFLLEDYISANLFYEYFKNFNINLLDFNKQVDMVYETIKQKNKDLIDNEFLNNKIEIIRNIKLDLSRKIIIEDFLNFRKSEIFEDFDNFDLIYEINIEYVNIYKNQIENLEFKIKNNKFNNINNLIDYLKKNDEEFFYKNQIVDNYDLLNNKIKNKIKNQIDFFILKNNDLISFIYINKSLKTYEGVIASIFKFETYKKIDPINLKCSELENLKNDGNIVSEKYEYSKLNKQIKENLININDYLLFENNNINTYVILCDLTFDKEVLNQNMINIKIENLAKEIELNFIDKYSKIYKLELKNE